MTSSSSTRAFLAFLGLSGAPSAFCRAALLASFLFLRFASAAARLALALALAASFTTRALSLCLFRSSFNRSGSNPCLMGAGT